MENTVTLPCGCQRKLESIKVDDKVYEVQIFGRTPEQQPLSDKEQLAIAKIIKDSLKERG